jgi:hypothetical protein
MEHKRKVVFRQWVSAKERPLAGCSGMSEQYTGSGLFHEWGTEHIEFESGGTTYTIALVECADGTIQKVLPEHIKFIQ